MSIFNSNMFQIVGDGEKLGIILPEEGIYLFDNYYAKSLNINISSPYMEVSSGDTDRPYLMRGLKSTPEMDLTLIGDVRYVEGGSIELFTKEMINKMTILELFRVINKKIERRK